MQIEIKTSAYAQNRNYLAITSALIQAGYTARLQLGTRYSEVDGVTITTNAPEGALDNVAYTKSAVTIMGRK